MPARRAHTDALGETIAALAARLHAATYELLVLLHEFDERSGWHNGFPSCAAQRRADALAWLAESALAANLDGGTAGDRYQVVLHVSTTESGDSTAESRVRRDEPAAAPVVATASDAFDGALEVDHGAVWFRWKRRSASRATRRWCTRATMPMARWSPWAE